MYSGRRISEGSIIEELHDNNTRLIWLPGGTIHFEISAFGFAISRLEMLKRHVQGRNGISLLEMLNDPIQGKNSQSSVQEATRAALLAELGSLKASAELRQFQRQNLQRRAETRIAMVSKPFSKTRQSNFTLISVVNSCLVALFSDLAA
jgi:hypothetical protein